MMSGFAETPCFPPFERISAFASSLSVGKTMSAVSRCSGSSAPTPHGFHTLASAQAMVNIVGDSDAFNCPTSAVAAAAGVGDATAVDPPMAASDPVGLRSVFVTPPMRCGGVLSGSASEKMRTL